MSLKEFFEKSNLYERYPTTFPKDLADIEKPAINVYCEKCNSNQTFLMINDYTRSSFSPVTPSKGEILKFDYLCASCRTFHRVFLVKVSDNLDHLIKAGQYPEIDISIDKAIEKALGENRPLFRKGLICEAQGYGIGAYAYYRRIVELMIDELINDIYELIDASEKEEYREVLEKTKSTQHTSEKINLVKEFLPSSLRPGNRNPLGVLYGILSEGIHNKSDDECINIAKEVKFTLEYLIKQVTISKQEKKEFTESMDKLLKSK